MTQSYVKLFERLREIREVKPKRKTFMDVSGYPHYENVVSNILAFLLDDSEEHGMKNLWLDALLSLALPPEYKKETRNIRVEREVVTEKGNRIDLLITSDDYIVCIENKIFSEVANDLLDYKNTASKRAQADNGGVVCILLSLTSAVYKERDLFQNVLYEDLFAEVRSRLGWYLAGCDNTWLMYMKDFISTIESLTEGSAVNLEFETLYRTHYEEIRALEKQKDEYFKAIKAEAEKVLSSFQEKWKEQRDRLKYPYAIHVRETIYSSRADMRASIVVDFNLDSAANHIVAVETSRDAWGWHIALYERRGKMPSFDRLLPSGEMRHPAQKDTGTKRTHGVPAQFYLGQHIIRSLSLETKAESVAEEICNMIDALCSRFLVALTC